VAVTPELAALRAALRAERASVLKKLAGLGEDDARRSTVGSGTNVAGLLQHLTFVESKWLEGAVARRRVRGERSMRVDPSVRRCASCGRRTGRPAPGATRSSSRTATPPSSPARS
jgi:hypothetical protein